VVDSEDEWYPQEVAAVEAAVKQHGLQLIVFAEWCVAGGDHCVKGAGKGGEGWQLVWAAGGA
jgi:hypothetical protein